MEGRRPARRCLLFACRLLLALGILGALAPPAAVLAGAAKAVPALIQVQERSGVARRDHPVTAGVPFPRGARRDLANLRLLADGESAPIPLQSQVQSRWPDGSVRWALLDWQMNAAPGQMRRYRLESGAAAKPKRALVVSEDEHGVAIDTGALQMTIPKQRFALLEGVRLNGQPAKIGAVQSFADVEGKRFDARPPTSVRVLERGPLRARVELRGEYGADLFYVIRVDAFAGQNFVRVLHSFEQRGARAWTSLRQMAIEIPLQELGATSYRAGREKQEPLGGALRETPIVLLQEDRDGLSLDGARQPERAAGWVEVRGPASGIALAARFFSQEYPQSFHLDSARLTYNLWAPEAQAAALGMGVAKTHEMVLLFESEAPTPAQLASLAEPVDAHADARWLASSGALANAIAPGAPTARFLEELDAGFRRFQTDADEAEWDDGGSLRCSDPLREKRRRGYYGMLNWGDWNFPGYRDLVNGCDTWGNLEYDLTQVLALSYAASGDVAYHSAMTAAARHFMDVDRVHSAAEPCNCDGMNHPRTALHFSFELGGVDLAYTWTEGLLSYFYLTGDERALEAARGISDYLVRRLGSGIGEASPRQWGWPIIALLATYDATGEARYRVAAVEYARQAMAQHTPTSGSDFGVGTLADALAYVHEHTGDAAARTWIVAHAAAVMASPPGADPRYFPVVAYVGHITGNDKYLREAAAAANRQSFGTWGKPFTLAGRTGFRILSLVP